MTLRERGGGEARERRREGGELNSDATGRLSG